jgi:hypothetical protein
MRPIQLAAFLQQALAQVALKRGTDTFTVDAAASMVADPVALYFPPGMPMMMAMLYGMEILRTPGQVTTTSEWQPESRCV